jgi:hypothetical protein
MQSGFVKVTLSLIVLLLLVIAFRPLSKPETAQAAGSVVQYRVTEIQSAGRAEVENEFITWDGMAGRWSHAQWVPIDPASLRGRQS